MSLRDALARAILELGSIEVSPSRHGSGKPAFFVGDREIAHFHGDDGLDLRLGRDAIRARRAELVADPRVTLRASRSADWLEVRFAAAADVAFAASLAAIARDVHVRAR